MRGERRRRRAGPSAAHGDVSRRGFAARAWRSIAVRSWRPEPGELAERLGRARLRFGVALAPVRQQHLFEQPRFAFGERAVHAQVPRLDAVPHEPGGDPRDRERVVVEQHAVA